MSLSPWPRGEHRFARDGVLVLIAALAMACTEHDPELDRVGGTGTGGATSDSGSSGAGAGGQGGQAGGAGGCSGAKPAKPTLPCDVVAVLQAKCQRCHTDPTENGAPFPLLTYEDTQDDYFGKPVHARMKNAIETDFMPATFVVLSPPVESLTAAEKKTLLDWLQCAQPADGAVCP